MIRKKALITGITGQDGSYLAEFLLEKGYEVHGMIRRTSELTRSRIDHLFKKIDRHYGDMTDVSSIESILKKIKPDEIYNLAAQSHVRISFDQPIYTAQVNEVGLLTMLEAMKRLCPKSKFYQASSSEMYGKVKESPQNEKTPFHPRSPYACSKAGAYNYTINYREMGLFISNGILFNHESERRGENFVTRKITLSLAKIKLGLEEKLSLGNLDSKRDWGHAEDYVKAMWMMLQQKNPDDYVIGTGENRSVREFLEEAAKIVGLNLVSNGKKGLDEKYLNNYGKVIVEINPKYFRPTEVNTLLADASKAKKILGWEPKIKFKELVKRMANSDLDLIKKSSSKSADSLGH